MSQKYPIIDVCIPTYRPDESIIRLLELLLKQTYPVNRIIIINTEAEIWKEAFRHRHIPRDKRIEISHISKEEFDHGNTRRSGMDKSDAEYVLMMTQDAIPYDERLIERLVVPMVRNYEIAVSYARQLPKSNSTPEECYIRSFNYPDASRLKGRDDLPFMGIKTFFCSNVCAMYRKKTYNELGGFVTKTIFNEDMIFARKVIDAGLYVYYCAEAKVLHSHNYSAREQFHRNFDLAVSQAEHPEVFGGFKSEGEGKKMVKGCIAYLKSRKKGYRIPGFIWNCGWRFLGFKLGRKYKKLPAKLVLKYTSNKTYWN